MEPRRFAYDSMGSHWEVRIWSELADDAFDRIATEVKERSQLFDETYSRFIPTSLISRLADQTGVFDVPEELVVMLRMYHALYDASGRKLNPLVGHTISDLGYDAAYSLTPKEEIRSTPDLFETVRIISGAQIEITKPCLIDLGALGKGFFVDRIADMLDSAGLTHYLVDGSGDIRYRGPEPFTVGLEDPADTSQVLGTLALTEGAVCASGIYRRAWRDLHHVIDPHESQPRRGIVASWAYARTAFEADALASCLFFANPKTLRTQFPFEYCVLYDDGSAITSPGFPGELFS